MTKSYGSICFGVRFLASAFQTAILFLEKDILDQSQPKDVIPPFGERNPIKTCISDRPTVSPHKAL